MAYSANRFQSYGSKAPVSRWVKPAIIKEPRKVCQWSSYQQAIFDDIAYGTGHTQVDSYAGTGKSTTLVEGLYHIPKFRQPALMVAFASANQKDLERKAPEGITVLTFHSLGFRASRKAFPKVGKPDDKGEKLSGFIKAERGEEPETYELRDNLSKCVSLCKGYLADSYSDIDPIMDRHEIDTCGDTRESFINSVIKVLDSCKKDTSRMDFDDMTWFPYVHNLNLEKYGHVLIDEDQDLNAAQIHIALGSCSKDGRITGVGDARQAIYQFRGADHNAVENIVNRLNAKRLTLSVTYRCAKSIVSLAQQFVPGLEAAPNAKEGLVKDIGEHEIENLVMPGDFILSRTNAPLIKWCLALLKAKVPANIQGKDLGKNMVSLIKRSKADSVDKFLGWLDEYEGMEVSRLVKLKRDTSVIQDKMECLRTLCEGTRDISDVKFNISKLFHEGDDHNRVILSTTHKAKGMERDRVFVLMDTYKPGKNTEEDNLTYVAYTRAKSELYLVSKS
jgi:DNA helicase-2/ATP-dependent DNA helicase PcrA